MESRESTKTMSRRQLLARGGKIAIAGSVAAAATGSIGFLTGCGSSSETGTGTAAMTEDLPWPYEKFTAADIRKAQSTAHDNWFEGFCTYAVLSGIVSVLREKVGGPYDQFPIKAFIFAHGGTAGWGGTCGTLIGAGIAASLVAGPQKGEEIVNEVMRYYSDTELPVFKPDNPKAYIKTVSKSDCPVCHLSVGKWMTKEGVGFLSAQQMERCGRLSGDVAGRTLELLNDYADQKFAVTQKAPAFTLGMPTQTNCTECHGESVPTIPKPGGGESLLVSGH